MKRVGLLAFAVLFILTACIVQAKDSGVRFSDLSGEVLVRPDEDRLAWEFAEMEMILNVMDHIQTKKDASAILSLTDMTTFVMKPESEIILNTESEKENKIELLAGKVWVNVKKMVKDGTMNVEMSQAVAGIKGTNITCSSNQDGSENRIQVLRGIASVMIRESKEQIELAEGEELVVKKGVKPEKVEINVEQEQKVWEEQTSKLGQAIQMNDIPETIKSLIETERSEYSRIKSSFEKLIAMEKVAAEEAAEIAKDAERFIGIILEDNLILASMRKKVEAAMMMPDVNASDKVLLSGYLRQIADASTTILGFQSEAVKIMRYQFKLSALYEDVSTELEMVMSEFTSVATEIDGIKTEVSSNPNGKSQDWFLDAIEVLQTKLQELEDQMQKAQALLEKNPTDLNVQTLIKQISGMQTLIGSMLKDLAIVEISPSTITELNQIDDLLSDQMVALQNEITAYNSISASTSDVAERRLQSSLKIMDNYARVRRNYLSAQRLYDSVMRATQGAKYKTSEQGETETLWQNISDRFQQLGIVANELQSNIESLESQLRQWLK
ncbi:MAG: FecR domain-containing protein [Candidatus Rifleibacteriota bacterium]